MNIRKCTNRDMQRLYDEDAWTWEGMTTNSNNLQDIIDWFKEQGCPLREEEFWLTTGAQMNEFCGGLTGSNAYPDDLSILSIELENIKDVNKLLVKKFEVGARWFSDIVENNKRR